MSRLTDIQAELKGIKKALEKQVVLLTECIDSGNMQQNPPWDEDVTEYLNKKYEGKENPYLPKEYVVSRDFDGLNKLVECWTLLKNSPAVYYDTFESMCSEIEDIKDYIETKGVLENMEGYRREIVDKYEDIVSEYQEIANSDFNSIDEICNFMNGIIDKISEII